MSQDLVLGRRKLNELSTEEQQLLDRAVLDFSGPTRPKPPEPPKKQETVRKPKPVRYDGPTPQGLPKGLDPYWWLNQSSSE